jgi:hypothetical protein
MSQRRGRNCSWTTRRGCGRLIARMCGRGGEGEGSGTAFGVAVRRRSVKKAPAALCFRMPLGERHPPTCFACRRFPWSWSARRDGGRAFRRCVCRG